MSNQTFINKEGKEVARQVTEIYSRVCGYMSPLARWNPGKRSEKRQRVDYKV